MYQLDDEIAAIKQIQELLRLLQRYNKETVTVPVDGIYSDATAKAVREFQARNQLPVTGAIDAQTYDLLYEQALTADADLAEPLPLYIFPANYVATMGEASDAVRAIQIMLTALTVAYNDFEAIPNTGIYDQTTADAIRKFQMRNHLPVTGDVDKKTWNALIINYNKYRDASQ